jgi:hypothetical protein
MIHMDKKICRAITRLLSILAVLGIASCGGGGGSGTSTGSATVGVVITDAPVGKWDQAIATITSVTLIGEDGQVTLFSGSETLDLLQLGDFSELFAVSDAVPPKEYSKIRLQLSDLVLNDIDPATGAVLESVHPQLVGNGKIDLNPRGPFSLDPGDVVFVELDFDMEKSLKIVETGNGKIIIRPVVFVNILANRLEGRLSRIHGDISGIDPVAGTFLLCQSEFASRWERHDGEGDDNGHDFGTDHCVTVRTDSATGIFAAEGLPQDFAGLAAGEEATVIGRLRRLDSPDMGEDHPFGMDAAVVEEGPLGTFRRLAGTAASGVDELTDQFGLNVAPGQGIATDAPLPVQLFEHSRIFARSGEELGRADIVADRNVLADGVLLVGTEDVLRSPLVILDTGPPPAGIALQGEILSVDAAAHSLVVTTDGGDRCIDATNAEVFLITVDDGLSATHGALADLQPGQRVAVFGAEGTDGCVAAGTILAET